MAFSDLHVAFPENRKIVEDLWPQSAADWLLVAGDVGERFTDIEWALRLLSERFATVVWAPGNHELWTHPADDVPTRGSERYAQLVQLCRSLGVLTPEDPYPVWDGPGGPATIAPLFLLYDYSFRPPGASSKAADWHIRYGAAAVVYGHLHIPRTTWHDGVRFEEVSLGYPREWQARGRGPQGPRQILPAPGSPQ